MQTPANHRQAAALMASARARFQHAFGRPHTVAAYAPGRVEVLGNHTDYNEGFVLSAAINFGTVFLAAPAADSTCRLAAGDPPKVVEFSATEPAPTRLASWPNYVIGVYAGLQSVGAGPRGFDGLLMGNVPLGAGLSSSASLEIAAGLALARLYGLQPSPPELARIGQHAEHEFAGVKCGLLDQISSLYGADGQLVMTDFRSLAVENVPLGADGSFLMCRTHAKHALVDGEYNARRNHCEEAARSFARLLDHPVKALRDVSWAEWERWHHQLDPLAARRAAHPIGENDRVLRGRALLAAGDLAGFGRLMYDSHASSAQYFENSCRELDVLVEAARALPAVHGARLSGGGFGGSIVALVHPRDEAPVAAALQAAYRDACGEPCDIRAIHPSAGAHLL